LKLSLAKLTPPVSAARIAELNMIEGMMISAIF